MTLRILKRLNNADLKLGRRLKNADLKLGRRLMRDDNILSRHVRSYALLTRSRLTSAKLRYTRAPLFDLSRLDRDGFVVLQDIYPSDLIETIRRKATTALEESLNITSRAGSLPTCSMSPGVTYLK